MTELQAVVYFNVERVAGDEGVYYTASCAELGLTARGKTKEELVENIGKQLFKDGKADMTKVKLVMD